MSSDEPPNPPNWVEIATLATLVITVAFGGAFTAYKYVVHDRRISVLEEQRTEAEVRTANEQVVELQGQIINSEGTVPILGQVCSVYPVVVSIFNSGETPVEIDRLELQYYRGQVTEVVRFDAEEREEDGGLSPVQQASFDGPTLIPRGRIIDLASPKWTNVESLRTVAQLTNCRVPHGQLRQHTFHLALPSLPHSELHRVTVTVFPKEGEVWDPLTWSGFTNSGFCAPGPFAAGLQDEDAGAPRANP